MESSQLRSLSFLYLAVAPGHDQSVDGMLMFEQARALLYDETLLFRQPFVWDDTFATSLYGVGLSVAYTPAIAVFSVFEPDVLQRLGTGVDLRRIYDDPVFTLAATPTQAALAAFAAHRTAMLVREFGFDRRTALWAPAFFGIGSPAFVDAGADFAQPLTAACVVYSIERGHHYRAADSRTALIGCAFQSGTRYSRAP